MPHSVPLSLTLLVVALPLAARGDDLAKEKEKLQGTWSVVNRERNGQPQPRAAFDGMTATFKGDTVTFKRMGEVTFTYTLDLTKEPWHFDKTGKDDKGKEVTYRGIFKYDVDGFLVLCTNTVPTEKRPKEFKTGREPDLADFKIDVLKRAGP
jgi:uncharacterized protein (TIGR03067 family)